MKVQFSAPRGNGPDGEGFSIETDLPVVPRIGENVTIGGVMYRAHAVDWCLFGDPDDPGPVDIGAEPFVYIVLRDN